jgi:hypothetical protein
MLVGQDAAMWSAVMDFISVSGADPARARPGFDESIVM